MLTLRIARQNCKIKGDKQASFAYVDLKQAFDTVSRPLTYRILRAKGVPEKIVRMVEELYRGHAFKVKRDGQTAERETATTRGLKQGCPLSPTLFNLVIEHVLAQAEMGAGLKFESGKNAKKWKEAKANTPQDARSLTHLLFADDIVLCAKTKNGLQNALNSLNTTFEKCGLVRNKKKTKWQCDGKAPGKIIIDNQEIERVEEFTYLGSVFTEEATDAADIERRIQKNHDLNTSKLTYKSPIHSNNILNLQLFYKYHS